MMLSNFRTLLPHHGLDVENNYPQSYGRLFPHVSEWGKVFLGRTASRDWRGSKRGNCNTAVGHYVFLTSAVGVLPGGLVLANQRWSRAGHAFVTVGPSDPTIYYWGFSMLGLHNNEQSPSVTRVTKKPTNYTRDFNLNWQFYFYLSTRLGLHS